MSGVTISALIKKMNLELLTKEINTRSNCIIRMLIVRHCSWRVITSILIVSVFS